MDEIRPLAFSYTNIKISLSKRKIDHSHKIFSLGSCFSDEIGGWLKNRGFNININPAGTIYYPPAITRLLRFAISGDFPSTGEVHEQDIYKDLHLHSKFDGHSHEKLKENKDLLINELQSNIKASDWLLLTFGTSIFYKHLSGELFVANCHKLPSSAFMKNLASVEEMHEYITADLEEVRKINPHLNIIVTVSPVRHIRDGLMENSRSKARLLMLCEKLEISMPDIVYFPAYEIMMDELRDYRFYADDLIHPSNSAVEWIGKRFSEVFFEENTLQISEEYQQLYTSLLHRPKWTHTEEYKKYIIYIQKRLKELGDKIPIPDLNKMYLQMLKSN